jgi:hypothetical protein
MLKCDFSSILLAQESTNYRPMLLSGSMSGNLVGDSEENEWV